MTMRSRMLIALCAGAVFGFSGAIAGDVRAEHRDDAPNAAATLPWEQARLFAEVYERIKREYVDEFEEIRLSTMGSYPGVGIEVVAEDTGVKILRPIEGSPADQAGLQAGDVIVKIDNKEVGSDQAGAIAQLRGPSGSSVKLTVRREGAADLLDFSLRRAKVDVRSVTHTTLD